MPAHPRRFAAFVALVCCTAIIVLVASAIDEGLAPFRGSALVALITLGVLAVVAELLAVEFADRVTMTVSNLPILLAMMFLQPEAAMLVAAAAGLWGCWREEWLSLAAFNVSNYVLPAAAGAYVFQALHHALGFPLDAISPALLFSGAVAAVTNVVANNGTAILGAALSGRVEGRSVRSFWRTELKPFLRSVAVLIGLGLMAAALYAIAGIVAVVLLFLPLFASQYMFQLLVREKEHTLAQKRLTDQYLEMNIGLAAAMIVLLDSKDQYTARHCAAVAMYCRDMAQALKLSEDQIEAIHLAGLLHDLGKVGTPDAVLGKPGRLDVNEWEFIREHPMKGAEVLSHLVAYRDVADIVQYHHERLDGSGYPLGVVGDQIPELAKILSVADMYHAMTSDRPYRRAMSSFEALKVLRGASGTTLDRRYVETLAGILRDKDLAYRDGSSTDFMGEYERGRINIKLKGAAFRDSLPSEAQQAAEDPA